MFPFFSIVLKYHLQIVMKIIMPIGFVQIATYDECKIAHTQVKLTKDHSILFKTAIIYGANLCQQH